MGIPRLVQGGHCQLKTYHTSASNTFASLEMDKNTEIEFVATFIEGIRDTKEREMLVWQLQSTCASCVDTDGKVRILCEWSDVLDGLRRCGLVEAENGGDAPLAKKRRKILIPKELIDRGMMK